MVDAQRKDSYGYFKNLKQKDLVRKGKWCEIAKRFGITATLYEALIGYGERPRCTFWKLVGTWFAFTARYFSLIAPSLCWVLSASDVWKASAATLDKPWFVVLNALARLNSTLFSS